jgi:hypothetical protein
MARHLVPRCYYLLYVAIFGVMLARATGGRFASYSPPARLALRLQTKPFETFETRPNILLTFSWTASIPWKQNAGGCTLRIAAAMALDFLQVRAVHSYEWT